MNFSESINESRRVLITGATGFIGRHLVKSLYSEGYQVILMLLAGVESGSQLPLPLAKLRPGLEIVYADLRNYNLTVRAIRDAAPDSIIHLAAVGVTDPFLSPYTAIRHNLIGTINLLRACFESKLIESNPGEVIVARTPGELSDQNIYAASKAAAWNFCKMYTQTRDWPIVGGMIFQAYGPWQPTHTLVQSAIRAALNSEDLPMTSGIQARDWIYAGDIADGFTTALEKKLPTGTTFELGNGETTLVRDVVQLIYHMVGGQGKPLIGALPDRPGEAPVQFANIDNAAALLNWKPSVNLEEGLRRTIDNVVSDG